jgi:putative salt-induced outer membrane protein YdiY
VPFARPDAGRRVTVGAILVRFATAVIRSHIMRTRTLAVVILLLTLACADDVRAAGGIILNTLQGTDDHVPGWSGSVDGLFSGSGGNTERVIVAAGGHAQWRGDRNRCQLRGAYGYEESNNATTARNGTVHLRHNYDIIPELATVAFVQVQENEFQRIKSRWLIGAGLRYDVVDGDTGKLLVGATPMLEMERLEGETDHTARGRLSTFLFLSRKLQKKVRVDGSAFVQPLFEDFGNLRTAGTAVLVAEVTGSLDLKTGVSVETNSNPAPGVEKTDWTTFMSLGVTF